MSTTAQSRSNLPPLTYEEMEDQRDSLDARLASILTAGEEAVPLAMVQRLSDGESPVLVWREHRGMSRFELAEVAAVPEGEIHALETGSAEPGMRAMARIAAALRVDLDELVPWSQD